MINKRRDQSSSASLNNVDFAALDAEEEGNLRLQGNPAAKCWHTLNLISAIHSTEHAHTIVTLHYFYCVLLSLSLFIVSTWCTFLAKATVCDLKRIVPLGSIKLLEFWKLSNLWARLIHLMLIVAWCSESNFCHSLQMKYSYNDEYHVKTEQWNKNQKKSPNKILT